MGRWRIGMRWWLAAAFVTIAAVTAALVATVSDRQTTEAVRSNSENVAVGKTVSSAFAVERALAAGNLADALAAIANRRDISLYVFARDGSPVGPTVSLGIPWSDVPGRTPALRSALAGRRFVETSDAGGATVTALPLHRSASAAAVVSYAPRPPAYARSLAIFHHETVRASLWAVLAAAVVGFLAATLVSRRLRRIDRAAAAIERGDFEIELRPRLRDEVGSLAATIDRMRRRLRASFAQLRAERDRLERLLEQLHQGVVAVDEDLVVRFANTTAARLTRRAPLTIGERLPESWEGAPVEEVAQALFRPDASVSESRVETSDGRTVSVVGVPAGTSGLAVLVLTDVTEQERRERAEREFVTNASHELRTPVTAIASAVEALQSGAKDSPVDRDAFVSLIERQSTRLTRLTRSLLVLARAQTQLGELQLEPVRLRPLLEEVAASSDDAGATAVAVDCDDDVVAFAQRDVAEQILANLVGNALRHSPRGRVTLGARADGRNVVIEVSDEGPGIPAQARERVFERFYSGDNGRRDGFGLGLAIARDAARALGGGIEIASHSGPGTTVRVTLAGVPRR
jgi:signal transduction histidine kinase